MSSVAIITGGASGIGLATSRLLLADGWHVVIVDQSLNGAIVADDVGASFIQASVNEYSSLARAFTEVWNRFGRLNFVFANAGVLETQSFYANHQNDQDGIPPPPDLKVIDVNLNGVIYTTHLAIHFFRQSEGLKSLIMTSSTGGLYPVRSAPLYAATKHGVLGLSRSIADKMWAEDEIQVNCICPGTTVTGIMGSDGWNIFPDDVVTTPDQVAQSVKSLLDDRNAHGKVVEIVQSSTFVRDVPEFLDQRIERLTLLTDKIVG
ncbi:15-hydroxyprostaglandin dehydrogenase [Penicillium sp. IBT 18751x]|nr:15-hydroxyprostaglandin dehydrogenase [Penicillium sp. IBT 18751x]